MKLTVSFEIVQIFNSSSFRGADASFSMNEFRLENAPSLETNTSNPLSRPFSRLFSPSNRVSLDFQTRFAFGSSRSTHVYTRSILVSRSRRTERRRRRRAGQRVATARAQLVKWCSNWLVIRVVELEICAHSSMSRDF